MSDETVDTSVDTVVDEAEPIEDAPVEGADALGDAGKKALEAMKAQRKAALDEAKAAKAERDALKAQLEGREAEHAAEQERQRVKDEALAAANKRILGAELRAAAKGKLADPTDAALYINLDEFEVSDDGSVDTDALNEAVAELLVKKPHLAAGEQPRFAGGGDGGARPEPKKADDLDEQIAAATAARNFPLVATLKQIKAAQTKG